MTNGVAVRLPFAPEHLSKDEPPSASGAGIETAIGIAMASAATGLCQGVAEYQNGGLTSTTKMTNGEQIAALYWLQHAHAGEIDFPAVAREQGKVVLRQYLKDDPCRQYTQEQNDAAIDLFIDETLAVLRRVTATMQAWANFLSRYLSNKRQNT